MVKSVIHLWHFDALDSLNSYFGNTSRFGDEREAVWTTSITISHWNIENVRLGESSSEEDHFNEGLNREQHAFPPESILSVAEKKRLNRLGSGTPTLEQRSLSLVITGDPSGYFWTCSFWCSITDAKSVKDCIQAFQPKIQRFIHQPASGRSIFFLIMLGHICELLATEYKLILSHESHGLDLILDLGVGVIAKCLQRC